MNLNIPAALTLGDLTNVNIKLNSNIINIYCVTLFLFHKSQISSLLVFLRFFLPFNKIDWFITVDTYQVNNWRIFCSLGRSLKNSYQLIFVFFSARIVPGKNIVYLKKNLSYLLRLSLTSQCTNNVENLQISEILCKRFSPLNSFLRTKSLCGLNLRWLITSSFIHHYPVKPTCTFKGMTSVRTLSPSFP